MIARDLRQRLVRPLAPTALVDHAHASRPLPAGLDADVLVNVKLPLRVVLVDAVPERQRVVELQAHGVAGDFVLQGLDFAEGGLEPSGCPGC